MEKKLLSFCEQVGQQSQAELDQIHDRLKFLSGELRRLQEKKDGSLTLENAGCGKNCLGCPHYQWRTWSRRVNGKTKQWFMAPERVKHPRMTAAYRQKELSPLIDEAINLIERKVSLVAAFSSFGSALRARKTAKIPNKTEKK